MRTIFKQKLDVIDYQTITVPVNHTFLSLGMKDGDICLWYECETDSPLGEIQILCFGTGCRLPPAGTPSGAIKHIGSVTDGMFVWHYYEYIGIE